MAAEPGLGDAWHWYEDDDIPTPPPRQQAVFTRWRRIVRSLHRIRRLQRIWGHLGGFLRDIPGNLRDRLRAVDP